LNVKQLRDFPQYAAAQERLAELQQREGELRRQIEDASRPVGNAAVGLEAEAAALIAGDEAPESYRANADELRHELAVVRKAVELQRGIVAEQRIIASREIATAELPRYRQVVGSIAKTLATLKEQIAAEQEIRDELYSGDVAYSSIIRPMGSPGGLTRFQIDAWTREAETYGLI
jgi:hypothetical protein